MSFFYTALALTLVPFPAIAQRPGGPPTGSAASPAYSWIFQYPLPIPQIAEPEFSEEINGRTIDYYSVEIRSFTQQVYPNLGPAHMTGYNGTAPGPTYMVPRGHETVVRCLNQGSGPAAMHLHGSYTHSPWDGWADDEMQVGQYKDYYYPNSENARSIWYHDHTDGSTAHNAYYGQAGVYIIYDPAEDSLALPSGNYDVPLAITDRLYSSNGDLASPSSNTNFGTGFYGDTIEVNGQPWPYLAVEPRKYRLRLYDMSLSRPYQLSFADENGNTAEFQVIASDSGLFDSPVSTSNVVIAMGERYEVIVDFSSFSGQNVTLKNSLQVAGIQSFTNTDKVMMFTVGNSVSDSSNNGPVPSTLNGAIEWPEKKTTPDYTFRFQQGGDAQWTINGVDFNDVKNRVLAKPEQGSTQLWTLVHASGPVVHPVHIHLVNLQVVSRTGGSRGVLPYEAAGLKDTVLLEPGETVQVLAYFGPWDGLYMFHCHNLVHEDNNMMAAFNVTYLESLGYEFNSTTNFANPNDPRFAPQDYNAAAFAPAAESSAVASLASLNAYQTASSTVTASGSALSPPTSSSATTTTLSTSATPTTTPQASTSIAATTTPPSTTAALTTTEATKTKTRKHRHHKHKHTKAA